jgi:TolB-like protein/Tfp pilus assembly protein PilF
MYTDMVGYTALGQRNETLSLALVEEQRKLIRQILIRHNGREVKTMGDSFLVVFPNALDAARCAYDIQRAVNEFNVSLQEDRRIHLRVGVHLGDVVESDNDISGDAVNIASRIQPLAEDGGVCLTRQVFDQVQNRFDLPLTSLGAKSLKNVMVPVEVFKMIMPWGEKAKPEQARPDRKRIAVLPFVNISPHPADDYFADGITEELIATMSKISGLRVIARTSITGYKAANKKIAEVARELEVGTVLEGSVRKAGNNLRITVQLIDCETSEHLWVESYDRELKDVFAIQTEISRTVSEALKVRLLTQEKAMMSKDLSVNPESYSLYLKGRFCWSERTKESIEKAQTYFEGAIDADSNFAPAYSGLADSYNILADYGWMPPERAYALAMEYAKKALQIDESLAEAHSSYALALMKNWKPDSAEREFKRAIELSPSYAPAHHFYATLLLNLKRIEEASDQEKLATELDPNSQIFSLWMAISLIFLGRTDEALQRLTKITRLSPDFVAARLWKSEAHALLSDHGAAIEEAQKAVELERNPSSELNLALFYAIAGKKADAEKILLDAKDKAGKQPVPQSLVGWIELVLGKTDEGFGSLEEALEARDENLLIMANDPLFKPYCKNPRWVKIQSRLGEWRNRPLSKADDAVRV